MRHDPISGEVYAQPSDRFGTHTRFDKAGSGMELVQTMRRGIQDSENEDNSTPRLTTSNPTRNVCYKLTVAKTGCGTDTGWEADRGRLQVPHANRTEMGTIRERAAICRVWARTIGPIYVRSQSRDTQRPQTTRSHSEEAHKSGAKTTAGTYIEVVPIRRRVQIRGGWETRHN